MNCQPCPISILIPTFGRDEVLVSTISQLLEQEPPAAEILVIDQSPRHTMEAAEQLQTWNDQGAIRWIRLQNPSQPGALNVGLLEATQPFLLCLDDDIRIDPGFISAHAQAFENDDQIWAVAGQILQPGEVPLRRFRHHHRRDPYADMNFPFRFAFPSWVSNGVSCNFSFRRSRALQIGGFDENFLPPVAYNFDADFSKRLIAAGGKMRFVPEARIYHLRAQRGGTRSLGSHLTSFSPIHGQGAYYFALRRGLSLATIRFILHRPVREVCTRFHLRHPWWIPVKLFGELRAFLQAFRMHLRGPRLLPIPRGSDA